MPPVLVFIGKPNCGKTTLIEKLIPALENRGVRVGTIKHHHGAIQMDTPGKDTWRHKQAGARIVLLSSPTGIGLIQDTAEDTPVEDLVSHYFQKVDLVIAEGYKWTDLPKIEVYRSSLYDAPLVEEGIRTLAMVSDTRVYPELPWFEPDDIDGLVDFILINILER